MNHNETISEVSTDFVVSITVMQSILSTLSSNALNCKYVQYIQKYILLIGSSSDWTSQANYL